MLNISSDLSLFVGRIRNSMLLSAGGTSDGLIFGMPLLSGKVARITCLFCHYTFGFILKVPYLMMDKFMDSHFTVRSYRFSQFE